MAHTVGAHILERLHEHGVRRVYGYPGDGINGILGGFHEHGERIEFIQAAHEELAAFMACAHAKFSGDVGVCLATSGPGRDPPAQRALRRQARPPARGRASWASRSRSRSAAATSRRSTSLTLFKDVASEYVQVAMAPAQVTHLIDRAVQIARATRSVTCVIVPADLQEEEIEAPPRVHGAVYSGGPVPKPHVVPHEPTSSAPPRCSTPASGSRCWSAQGARGAAAEVEQVAELLGAAWPRRSTGATSSPTTCPT